MYQTERYRDVIIALKLADDYGQNLGRIQLQKFIYLADIISVLWNTLAPKNGHETYRNGPYDSDIQNAVDILSFRGFISIVDINIRDEKRVSSNYRININGKKLFDRLKNNLLFKNRIELYCFIAKKIDERGWANLMALVYAEPTYSYSKINGWGYRFNYSSLLTNDTLQILRGFEKMLNRNSGFQLSKENLTSLYFKLLDKKIVN